MPPRRIFSKLANTRSINRKGRRTIYLVFFFFLLESFTSIRVIYRTHVHEKNVSLPCFDCFLALLARNISIRFLVTRKITPCVFEPTVARSKRVWKDWGMFYWRCFTHRGHVRGEMGRDTPDTL